MNAELAQFSFPERRQTIDAAILDALQILRSATDGQLIYELQKHDLIDGDWWKRIKTGNVTKLIVTITEQIPTVNEIKIVK